MHGFCAICGIGRLSRTFKSRLVATIAIAILGVSGLSSLSAVEELTNIKIALDYRLYGPNAPLWYAQSSGLFRAAGINATVDGSSGSGDAINNVAAGAYDAAYADIGTLAEFWARNPSIAPKLVMVILDRSPWSIVSLKNKNITKLSDLIGRKVGTGQADSTSRMFPVLLKINNIPIDKITRKPVDQKLRDAMLARGDFDADLGYDTSIVFNLMTLGIKPEDTNLMYYADNGFNFYDNGLLVSRSLIDKNPDLVKRLTRAVALAWIASIKNPRATAEALGRRDALADVTLETTRLQWMIDKSVVTATTKADGFGAINIDKLNAGLKTIADGFELSKVPTAADIYDDRFLPPLEDRQLPQ